MKEETLLSHLKRGQGYLNFGQKNNGYKPCLFSVSLQRVFLYRNIGLPQCLTTHNKINIDACLSSYSYYYYDLMSRSTSFQHCTHSVTFVLTGIHIMANLLKVVTFKHRTCLESINLVQQFGTQDYVFDNSGLML